MEAMAVLQSDAQQAVQLSAVEVGSSLHHPPVLLDMADRIKGGGVSLGLDTENMNYNIK